MIFKMLEVHPKSWCSNRERLPRFSVVLRIESCSKVDDLSCLEMFGRCGKFFLLSVHGILKRSRN